MADFCRDSDGRLVAIAHLTLTDVEGSAAELERAVADGCDRGDEITPHYQGRAKPSEIFREQCFISGDPDETTLPLIIDHVGADCFVWASDYPHPDHPPHYIDAVTRLVSGLGDETRAKVLGGNAKRLYRI